MSEGEAAKFSDSEILHIIETEDREEIESLFAQARKIREIHYGRDVFFRGLIEFTNYCKNDCYYCGIRCSNKNLKRYRMSLEEILACCREGDKLGFKTFVLQGGEDPFFTTERAAAIVSAVRSGFSEHAITLSIGERPCGDYELFFKAGANRYLLRHETADSGHYAKLHPASMTLDSRKNCLWNLKKTGYQTGAGFMVGTPYQTPVTLLADIRFLEELQPQMAGIGPFIPQKDTPFSKEPAGDLTLCLKMLALMRLILPKALLPATTAIGTLAPNGRELALNAGANVVMPNLTPAAFQKLYSIYDNKHSAGSETIDKIRAAGYTPNMTRGDAK